MSRSSLPVKSELQSKFKSLVTSELTPYTSAGTAFLLKALHTESIEDLKELIQQYISHWIGFTSMSIHLVNEPDKSHKRYLSYSPKMDPGDDFGHVKAEIYPFNDGFFNVIINSTRPVIINLADIVKKENELRYAVALTPSKTGKIMGVPLEAKNKKIGIVLFYFATPYELTENEEGNIKDITPYLSIIVTRILDTEANSKATSEKNMLLSLVRDITAVKDKSSLTRVIHNKVRKMINFNHMLVLLVNHNDTTKSPDPFYFEEQSLLTEAVSKAISMSNHFSKDEFINNILIADYPVSWSTEEVMRGERIPRYIAVYVRHLMKKILGAPIIRNGEAIGVLLLFSEDANAFNFQEFNLIGSVCNQLSVAVVSILANEEIIRKDKEGELFLSMSRNLVHVRDRAQFVQVLKTEFYKVDFSEEAAIFFLKPENQYSSPVFIKQTAKTVNNERWLSEEWKGLKADDRFLNALKQKKEAVTFEISELLNMETCPDFISYCTANDIKKIAVVPIGDGVTIVGLLFFLSKEQNIDLKKNLDLIDGIAAQLSAVLSNIVANEKIAEQFHEITRYKQKLEIENLYLQEEIQTTHNYSEIVGTSNAMKQVFHLVSQVANTTSSVLILGETGTGKELIARAIHNTSSRKNKLMVKVNCATLPVNLIESELFGHERGSFTGATDRRIGKFELANNGTIFLDEIGELPLGLQVKLLRALQEKEIERIGGKTVIKTDVRVIAATNRDLRKEVQIGNFRSDLYFRLNVFPISIPSLRNRKEDIPLLASHFLTKHAKKLAPGAIHFTSKAIKQLIAYNWPGNVRELEHLIERTILLTKGNTISQVYLPPTDSDKTNVPLANTDVKTIDEVEREHILSVLKMVNGKVSGVGGAAEILKIPATTLSSKIRRLKIKKGVS